MAQHDTEDNAPTPQPEPDMTSTDAVVDQMQNDTPGKQDELTGESVTAPDDTLGG